MVSYTVAHTLVHFYNPTSREEKLDQFFYVCCSKPENYSFTVTKINLTSKLTSLNSMEAFTSANVPFNALCNTILHS